MSATPRGALLFSASLCNKCSSLFTTEYRNPHHEDIESLERSMAQGCYICIRLGQEYGEKARQLDLDEIRSLFGGSALIVISQQGTWDFVVVLHYKVWKMEKAAYQLVDEEQHHSNSNHDTTKLGSLRKKLKTKWWRRSRSVVHEDSGARQDEPTASISMSQSVFYGLREDRTRLMEMPHYLNARTCSSQSMRQARSWIDHCRLNHSKCNRPTSSPRLPTRLINVTFDQTLGFRAKLCDTQSLSQATPYLTLSHRWGRDDPTTLMTYNLDALCQDICVETLSRVFRDALEVTASVGLAYIWIDSLCIIQNDKDDWERESRQMGHIYRNALCNLAASEFDSGDGGLLVNERCWSPMAAKIYLENTPVLDSDIAVARESDDKLMLTYEKAAARAWKQGIAATKESFNVSHGLAEDATPDPGPCSPQNYIITTDDLFGRVRKGPLFTRAWVLQEQILASRTLHFGKEQIFWECHEIAASETWPQGFGTVSDKLDLNPFHSVHTRETLKDHVFHFNIEDYSHVKPLELHAIWRDILCNYMKRDITFASDRLLALSGIAAEFEGLLNDDTYCYGHWLNDPLSLMWSDVGDQDMRKNRNEQPSRPEHLIQDPPPTWSWASQNQRINFDLQGRPKAKEPTRIFTRIEKLIHEPSRTGLCIRGPLLLMEPSEFSYREEFGFYIAGEDKWAHESWAFQVIRFEESGIETFAGYADPPRLESKLKSMESDVKPPFYFMPMFQVDERTSPETKERYPHVVGTDWMPHRVAGLIVGKAPGKNEGQYVRLDTGLLHANEEDMDGLFEYLQRNLTEDDFKAKYEDGSCTITLY